ncbi:MAG TPA: hypothetical protein DCP02_02745 [Actinobacteria bacterium]|nr:hypothetical protein [Actinomycetota bacterium]
MGIQKKKYIALVLIFICMPIFLSASYAALDSKDLYRISGSNDSNIDESIFVYALQSVGFKELLGSGFDIAVIDIDDCSLDLSQLIEFQSKDRVLLSYLSIGEAEDYRSYWTDGWRAGNPDFIYEENLLWPGNYKVKYWHYDWQKIIYSQLDKIIENGFGGAYLDIVDAYKYFEDIGVSDAAAMMIDFVVGLSEYSKSINSDFLIIPQNAEILLDDPVYFDAIDGIGKEELYFVEGKKQSDRNIELSSYYLDKVKRAGKDVFIISYVTEAKSIKEVINNAKENNYYYFIAKRELDSIDCLSKNI